MDEILIVSGFLMSFLMISMHNITLGILYIAALFIAVIIGEIIVSQKNKNKEEEFQDSTSNTTDEIDLKNDIMSVEEVFEDVQTEPKE